MFYRKLIKQLVKWSEGANRKPLVLRGARQVGKTTLINEFSKEFDNYLYVNLENEQLVSIFSDSATVDELLVALFLYSGKKRKKGKILLFIDEIQNSSQAVSKLRYFYEEIPEIYVIAAGSLLESLMDVHISFPVGRVEYMAIRPCTFTEFLGALGESELANAIEDGTFPPVLHARAMEYFNTYTLIGGMPEVVAHYAKSKDLVALNAIYESLLQGYKDDVEKYAKNNTATNVIRHILNYGWAYAAQIITFERFANSNYKSREMGEAFRTLEKTLLLELVYPTTESSVPISPRLNRSPKLIWFDTGLINYAVNLQKEVFGAKDILDAWRGHIAEQIVAQEILALDDRVSAKRHFWVRAEKSSQAEVDFLIQYDNKIIPIEVKSGHNAKLKSLHIFMESANHDIAIRVWSNPFSIDSVTTSAGKVFRLINMPFYFVGSLFEILDKANS